MVKRFASVMVLVIVLLSGLGMADYEDINLAGMSYDQLVELKDQINMAIWKSQEWQEVTVPQGEWVVGTDIPAGKWTIRCADVDRMYSMLRECDIEWGFKNSNGRLDRYESLGGGQTIIHNPEHKEYKSGQVTEITVELKEGMLFVVNSYYAPALFTPYAGKPSLGFK